MDVMNVTNYMKRYILIILLIIILIVITIVTALSTRPNVYRDSTIGFEFTYPNKTFVYAVDKTATSSLDIVFSYPGARATESPLARIYVTTHDVYKFPTRNIDETRDDYPFTGFHKLTSEKIIKEDPTVIEFIWTNSEDPELSYKEYRVVKFNKENIIYFDLETGQGFTPDELRETALSFRFSDLKK